MSGYRRTLALVTSYNRVLIYSPYHIHTHITACTYVTARNVTSKNCENFAGTIHNGTLEHGVHTPLLCALQS